MFSQTGKVQRGYHSIFLYQLLWSLIKKQYYYCFFIRDRRNIIIVSLLETVETINFLLFPFYVHDKSDKPSVIIPPIP